MSANTAIRKVVLIGAGGNLGSIILPALSKAFEVTIVTRATSSASYPENVRVAKVIYTEAELVKVFKGQDAVVSAVGAMGFLEQKVFIDAAVKASVKRFIPAEYSSSTLNDIARQLVPVFEYKKEVLDYLREKESTGLTWTGLATGPLLDWGLRTGFLGFDLAGQKATIWDEGMRQFAATNQADFAAAVVGILKNPSETANKYLQISTVTCSQATILEALEVKSGQKWAVEHVETNRMVVKGRQMIAEGEMTGMFLLAQAASYGKVEGIEDSELSISNSVVGLPAEGSLDETIAEVLK